MAIVYLHDHRFEPSIRRAGTSASTEGASVPLATVGVEYDAALLRGGLAVANASGSAVSNAAYAGGRRAFEASSLDAVERALEQLWSELSEDGIR